MCQRGQQVHARAWRGDHGQQGACSLCSSYFLLCCAVLWMRTLQAVSEVQKPHPVPVKPGGHMSQAKPTSSQSYPYGQEPACNATRAAQRNVANMLGAMLVSWLPLEDTPRCAVQCSAVQCSAVQCSAAPARQRTIQYTVYIPMYIQY